MEGMAGEFVKIRSCPTYFRYLALHRGVPMELFVKHRRIQVEFPPIILTTGILGWSVYYYFSTVNTPHGGAESVLFIRPLTLLLAICYPFVLKSFIKTDSKTAAEEEPSEVLDEADRGFLDHHRLFFAASLAVYAVALTFFGYLIPSVLFVSIVCFYLGVRSVWILTGLPLLLSVILAIVFRSLIGVPIPIWPW